MLVAQRFFVVQTGPDTEIAKTLAKAHLQSGAGGLVPPRNMCRSLKAVPPPSFLETYQKRAIESDHSHAGFPQGFIDATNLICLIYSLRLG